MEWISAARAAEIIGCGRTSVHETLKNTERRQATWGAEGEGWRQVRQVTRWVWQVSRLRAEQLAAERRGDTAE